MEPTNLAPDEATNDDVAFDGTSSWRVSRSLRDGTVMTIRPITPDDREELRREFQRTSPQTRYLRFLGAVGDLNDAMLTYLTCVDQKDHIALVATITSPDLKSERGVGVARVIRLAGKGDVAEAAITVVDEMQRRGVGAALAFEIERAARASGIRHIRAEVLEGNAAMRAILENAGAARVDSGDSAGTLSYDIALEQPREREGPWRLGEVLRGVAQTIRDITP